MALADGATLLKFDQALESHTNRPLRMRKPPFFASCVKTMKSGAVAEDKEESKNEKQQEHFHKQAGRQADSDSGGNEFLPPGKEFKKKSIN